MKSTLYIFCFLYAIFTVGCQKKPSEEITISDVFKTQIMEFLKEGTKLSRKTEDGISYNEFSSMRNEFKSSFDLVNITWPKGFSPVGRNSFKKSNEGYDLVFQLWKMQLERKQNQFGNDAIWESTSLWGRVKNYAGSEMEIHVDNTGRRQLLTNDENISKLITIAGAHFEDGRATVLSSMEN